MMKKRTGKRLSVLILTTAVMLGGLMLTACGSSNSDTAEAVTSEVEQAGFAAEAGQTDVYDSSNIYQEEADTGSAEAVEIPEQGEAGTRKLIKTVNLNVQTEEFGDLYANVTKKIEELGGYVESSSTYNGSYGSGAMRSAEITARIPAGKVNELEALVAEKSNITNRSEQVEDVTLQYVDLESHKLMLKTEQERLISLLGQSETIEDIIAIESRLSEVRYQIESMEAQLRTYDNKVEYSTVYLNITEVERYTPKEELTTAGRIKTGFSESVYHVTNALKEFGIGFIVVSPYLLTWAAFILIFVLIVLLCIRISAARKRKKEKQGISPVTIPAGSSQIPGAASSHTRTSSSAADASEHNKNS